MMDTKIRAWHKELKEMFWFDILWGNQWYKGNGYVGMLRIGEERNYGRDNRIPVDPTNCELLRPTGLLDKNGNEIYEGDILDFEPYEWNRTSWKEKSEWEYPKWVVEWNEQDGKWDTGGGLTNECKIYKSIIGNIYENPELLKQPA